MKADLSQNNLPSINSNWAKEHKLGPNKHKLGSNKL